MGGRATLADRRARRAGGPAGALGARASPTGSPRSAPWSAPASSAATSPRADQIVIAVTVLGACTQAPVLRSGAEPGDVVALAGRQGWAAAGSPCWAAGSARRGCWSTPTGAPSRRTTPGRPPRRRRHGDDRRLRRPARRRRPRRRRPGVAIDVTPRRSRSPSRCSPSAPRPAPTRWFILGGGDDHALLATFPADTVPEGWARSATVAEGEGVTVDGAAYDGPAGWTHF